MSAQILDGKTLAESILHELKHKICASLSAVSSPSPKLAIIQIAGDPASSIYVQRKLTIAKKIGIETQHLFFPNTVSFDVLAQHIHALNDNNSIHGILLQLPLPSHLADEALLNLINSDKDVDGLTACNLGYLAQNQPQLISCTPKGIMRLLNHYAIPLTHQEVVIVNASKLVGRPLSMLMLAQGATVTLCNSKTANLKSHVSRADIIISATGKPHIIPSHWLKIGSTVIDVGVHRSENGLIGDFEFASAQKYAQWITPVPGGVGPMTVAMLMENVYQAFQKQQYTL